MDFTQGLKITRIKRDPYFSMKDAHLHNFYEMYYLLTGTRRFFVNDTIYNVSKGELILIEEGALHRTTYISGGSHERICITFEESFLEPLFREFGKDTVLNSFSHPHIRIPQSRRDYFEDLISKAHREMMYQDTYSFYLARSHVYELILFILRLNSITKQDNITPYDASPDDQIMEKAAKYICSNYQSPLTLEETAVYCNMSTTYFSKKFKAVTGFGFKEYLINIRIREASRLLLHTKLPITEIALLSGFNDSNYFGDVFKRMKGISPCKYRKNRELV